MEVHNVHSSTHSSKKAKRRLETSHSSQSDEMFERVEKVVLEDCRISMKHICSKVCVSVRSAYTVLHADLKIRKVSSRKKGDAFKSFKKFKQRISSSTYVPVEQCFSMRSVPPPGGVEEMQGGGRRVHLEWGAYIAV
ncbi:hypothetical protein FHG87_020813 [Trinorchestia longiramus]|nr:hypothetical protein FHG87_020813 [Trinorchestia longiramus]